jgi:farnesyl diphosphate synthase
VTLMGLDYAQKQAKELQETAIQSLDGFGEKALALKDLALLVVNRAK